RTPGRSHRDGEGTSIARGCQHYCTTARSVDPGRVPDERHPVVVFPRAWRPVGWPSPAAARSRRRAVARGRPRARDRRHLLARLLGPRAGRDTAARRRRWGHRLGEPNGQVTLRIEALAAAFRAAELPVTIAPDIRTLIWRKLAFNLSAGPMCV